MFASGQLGRRGLRNPIVQEPEQELGRHPCAPLGHVIEETDGEQVGLPRLAEEWRAVIPLFLLTVRGTIMAKACEKIGGGQWRDR